MSKEKTYYVYYRERGNVKAEIFETCVTARNKYIASVFAKNDMESKYTIIKISLDTMPI